MYWFVRLYNGKENSGFFVYEHTLLKQLSDMVNNSKNYSISIVRYGY